MILKLAVTAYTSTFRFNLILTAGENDRVEFKQTFSFDVHRFENTGEKARLEKNEFNIPKAICGFANSNGGTLYIGVVDRTNDLVGLDNDYEVLGTDADGFEAQIIQYIDFEEFLGIQYT